MSKAIVFLINLASDEYYKSVKENQLDAQIVKPVFLDNKNGKYKVVSFYAKKARGLMCRFIIQNRLERIEQLKEFDLGGYWFDATSSTEKNLYLSEISMNKILVILTALLLSGCAAKVSQLQTPEKLSTTAKLINLLQAKIWIRLRVMFILQSQIP